MPPRRKVGRLSKMTSVDHLELAVLVQLSQRDRRILIRQLMSTKTPRKPSEGIERSSKDGLTLTINK